ncbi:MAG: glycosyltransferase [Lachnospiraceae bacterium]|nr:glycosyltransferase [Lachnospiraceae bacterium]
MMNKYCISVIIPVYNAEKYLEKCLDSIIAQTIYEEIEVIVVNDGSTDGTDMVLEKYSSAHSNFTIIKIENGGVSNARNVGMQNAKGEFVTFVDADDWIEPDCYEKMYRVAKDSSADIVAAGMFIDAGAEELVVRKLVDEDALIHQIDAVKSYLCGDMDVHVCTKIFRHEVIAAHEFSVNINIAEDRLFVYECIIDSNTVYMMKDCFYHYFQNEDSVMNQSFSKKNLDNITVGKKIKKMTRDVYPDMMPYAESMYVSMECRLYGELYASSEKRNFEKIYEELKKDIQEYSIFNAIKYMSKKHFIALLLSKISPSIYNTLRGNSRLKFRK